MRKTPLKKKSKTSVANNRFYKGDICGVCSIAITIKNKTGKCRSCGMIGHKRNLGRVRNNNERKSISLSKMGNKNPNWKGDKCLYHALHRYVERRLIKPELCKCNLQKPLDLANKGIYDRNLENWEWLCRRCHMESDGRMKNLKQFNEKSKNSIAA